MSPGFRAFARKNWLLLSVLALGFAFAIWFASRLMLDALFFNDPSNVDVDLKPWMTPRYVVMTYDLPREFVADMLELDGKEDRRIRLGRLAADRGMTMEALTEDVRAAAEAYREAQQ